MTEEGIKTRKNKGGMGKTKKIKTFLVATNIDASQPPERRTTGTPHARANFVYQQIFDRK